MTEPPQSSSDSPATTAGRGPETDIALDGPVPLSLSSLAHLYIPLEDGVLDAMSQLLQHTLLACINYARVTAPNTLFRDLYSTDWKCSAVQDTAGVLPEWLAKTDLFVYQKHSFVCLSSPKAWTNSQSFTSLQDWTNEPTVLAKTTLWYVSAEELSEEDLEDDPDDDDSTRDASPSSSSSSSSHCLLIKALIEYRSKPSKGSKLAVETEELSMLTIGASVDDDVKYGALAGHYDKAGPYQMAMESVRGKSYHFVIQDAVLANGERPKQLMAFLERYPNHPMEESSRAFLHNLRVQVRDIPHNTKNNNSSSTNNSSSDHNDSDGDGKKAATEKPSGNENDTTEEDNTKMPAATKPTPPPLTKLHLTLNAESIDDILSNADALALLPSFHHHTRWLSQKFLLFCRPVSATALPCRQTLLLEPEMASQVYCNGKHATQWGADPRIGSHYPALFGLDLHSIPVWHGHIVDYEQVKHQYAQMWQEIAIDARLGPLNLNGMLLQRLMYGKDGPSDEDEYDDDDDDVEDAMDDDDDPDKKKQPAKKNTPSPSSTSMTKAVDTSMDTLESQIFSSTQYDPVGIVAKALGTKFAQEFGREAFPCTPEEVPVVHEFLGHRKAVVVPQRVIDVVRRGGYFHWKRTMDEMWFTENVRTSESEYEKQLVNEAIQYLQQAMSALSRENNNNNNNNQDTNGGDTAATQANGLATVSANHVLWLTHVDVTSGGQLVDPDPIRNRNMCRYHEAMKQFYVNDALLAMDSAKHNNGRYLGWILAQAHPNRAVADSYIQNHFLGVS